MNATFDYAMLRDHIDEEGWWFAASEVHGILSALVALNHADAWREMLFAGRPPASADFFAPFCKDLEAVLASDDLAYALLLPEEGSCAARAEALVQWAEGFLLAVHFCKQHFAVSLDAQAQGFVTDVTEIATLDTDVGEDEESQTALTDVEEHCRLGVMMLYAASRSVVRKDIH